MSPIASHFSFVMCQPVVAAVTTSLFVCTHHDLHYICTYVGLLCDLNVLSWCSLCMWCLHFKFQKLVSGLSVENPLLPTILSSLKEVAKIDAEVFEGDVDSVINKEFAVKKVLRRDETVSDTVNDT